MHDPVDVSVRIYLSPALRVCLHVYKHTYRWQLHALWRATPVCSCSCCSCWHLISGGLAGLLLLWPLEGRERVFMMRSLARRDRLRVNV